MPATSQCWRRIAAGNPKQILKKGAKWAGRGGNAQLKIQQEWISWDTEPIPHGNSGTALEYFGRCSDVQSELHTPRSIGIRPPWEQSRGISQLLEITHSSFHSQTFFLPNWSEVSKGRTQGLLNGYQLHQSALTGYKSRNLRHPQMTFGCTG